MSALGCNSCSGASLVQLEKNLVFITASSSRIFYMQVDLGFPFHELNCYSLAFENSVDFMKPSPKCYVFNCLHYILEDR